MPIRTLLTLLVRYLYLVFFLHKAFGVHAIVLNGKGFKSKLHAKIRFEISVSL